MGVDGGFDFVPGGFEVHGEADFGDHLGAFAADDVRADDLTVRLAVEDLDEAFGLGGGELGRRVLGGMLAVGAGLGGGIAWLLYNSL